MDLKFFALERTLTKLNRFHRLKLYQTLCEFFSSFYLPAFGVILPVRDATVANRRAPTSNVSSVHVKAGKLISEYSASNIRLTSR